MRATYVKIFTLSLASIVSSLAFATSNEDVLQTQKAFAALKASAVSSNNKTPIQSKKTAADKQNSQPSKKEAVASKDKAAVKSNNKQSIDEKKSVGLASTKSTKKAESQKSDSQKVDSQKAGGQKVATKKVNTSKVDQKKLGSKKPTTDDSSTHKSVKQTSKQEKSADKVVDIKENSATTVAKSGKAKADKSKPTDSSVKNNEDSHGAVEKKNKKDKALINDKSAEKLTDKTTVKNQKNNEKTDTLDKSLKNNQTLEKKVATGVVSKKIEKNKNALFSGNDTSLNHSKKAAEVTTVVDTKKTTKKVVMPAKVVASATAPIVAATSNLDDFNATKRYFEKMKKAGAIETESMRSSTQNMGTVSTTPKDTGTSAQINNTSKSETASKKTATKPNKAQKETPVGSTFTNLPVSYEEVAVVDLLQEVCPALLNKNTLGKFRTGFNRLLANTLSGVSEPGVALQILHDDPAYMEVLEQTRKDSQKYTVNENRELCLDIIFYPEPDTASKKK